MTEWLQDPLFTEREILEGLPPYELALHSVRLGSMVTGLEASMDLTHQVLEGYGTTVEEQLELNKPKE